MLSFLDRLCRALTDRDAATIRQLLAHPMAATLPPAVRAEAAALADRPLNPARAPLHAFVFAHRMAQLMATVRRQGAATGDDSAELTPSSLSSRRELSATAS